MKHKALIIPFFIFIFIITLFFYLLLLDRNPSKVPSALIGKNVPSFQGKTLIKNKIFSFPDDLDNKVTIINFFASWCKPCRDEHKYIQKISNFEAIKTIGINYKDNNNKAKKWLKENSNPYSDIIIDNKGIIAIDWGVYGIPETFVVDSKGTIKFRHVGPIRQSVYKKISKIIDEINNNK